MNKTDITVKKQQGGKISNNKSEEVVNDMPVVPMTDEEVHAAALSDPDAQPLSKEDFARMKSTPRAKSIRYSLQLTQEEFASRFRIPLGTLRDWEQGRSEPDRAMYAYLRVIAVMPEAVERALQPPIALAE
ncbi:MAG TPA: hypothetical protein VN207_08360 [Ktedonobacteraceae bacterium]|nr:hypothetical protein [Ktedonobacteraceae bacterium]